MKRYIRASEETAWMVTYGQDTGNAETGPRVSSGEYLIYAVSEDEACRKFEEEYVPHLDGYEGCWARRATQEEIDEWYAYMNEPEDLPFSSTRTNKKPIKSAQGKPRYKFKFEISQVWYEDGETVGDTWQEFAYATAENPLNARIKIENRLEKEYGSKNDEWELVLKVIEGPDGYDDDMKYSSREGYIKSSQETYQLYQNKRNENKYIEVKKAKDGHTYYRQFMYWNTDRGPVKNYSGSATNRGRYHRTRLDSLDQVLEDYVPVDDVHSEEDVFESIKTNKKSIKASEFIVTVGDLEKYYIEADNEDDALQEFLDLYAEPEDLEEYEEDPSYIWVRESEDD